MNEGVKRDDIALRGPGSTWVVETDAERVREERGEEEYGKSILGSVLSRPVARVRHRGE
jgi:hypothetical protein